jgi:hypothetical protein
VGPFVWRKRSQGTVQSAVPAPSNSATSHELPGYCPCTGVMGHEDPGYCALRAALDTNETPGCARRGTDEGCRAQHGPPNRGSPSAPFGARHPEDVGDTGYSRLELVLRKIAEIRVEFSVSNPGVEHGYEAGAPHAYASPPGAHGRTAFRNQQNSPGL